MLECLESCQPSLGVLLEHLLDKVLRLNRELAPILWRVRHNALFVFGKDLLVVLSREHELACEEDVKNDPCAKDVDLAIVAQVV